VLAMNWFLARMLCDPEMRVARKSVDIAEFRTWALDVADNASSGIVHKLNSNLGNTSTGTYMLSESWPLY